MNDLLNWLSNPSRGYTEGLGLYQKYTNKKDLDFFRSAGEPEAKSLHFRMIVQRLQNAARILSENPKLAPKPEPYKVDSRTAQPITNRVLKLEGPGRSKKLRVVDNPLVEITQLPEALQQKYLQNKDLYKEIAGAHAAMREAKSDDERKELYSELQRLEAQHASNWQEIDSWWLENKDGAAAVTGKAQGDPVKEALEKAKRVELLQNYIRRYRDKPEKKELFEKYEAELKALANA